VTDLTVLSGRISRRRCCQSCVPERNAQSAPKARTVSKGKVSVERVIVVRPPVTPAACSSLNDERRGSRLIQNHGLARPEPAFASLVAAYERLRAVASLPFPR